MEQEQIKDFFLFAAAVRNMPSTDQRKVEAEEHLKKIEEDYIRSFFIHKGSEDNKKLEDDEFSWQEAFQYVANMFKAMDDLQEEANHLEQCSKRKAYWRVISNIISEWRDLKDVK